MYFWLFIGGSIFSVLISLCMGAMDVAHNFATSIGSKALSIKTAILITIIFELGGAVLLGTQVANTFKNYISNTDSFVDNPSLYMYGMFCVIVTTFIIMVLSSYYNIPISSTQTAVASIIGMSLANNGLDGVLWFDYRDDFSLLSKFKGVIPILIYWIITPIICFFLSSLIFYILRRIVLRKENSLKRTYIFFPFLVCIVVAIYNYSIIYKGFSYKIRGKTLLELLGGDFMPSVISWGSGIIIATLVSCLVIVKSILSNRVEYEDLINQQDEEDIEDRYDINDLINEVQNEKPFYIKIKDRFLDIINTEVHEDIIDENTNNSQQDCETFDGKTENMFKSIQIIAATMTSFTEGSNDIANAVGPLFAIYSIYKNNDIINNDHIPLWMLFMGGAGIITGFILYGHRLVKTVGVNIIKISPSRGFCIDLSTIVIIIIGSIYGIPLSAGQCLIGSICGIGMCEKNTNINKKLVYKFVLYWILNLFVSSSFCAALFLYGVNTPN